MALTPEQMQELQELEELEELEAQFGGQDASQPDPAPQGQQVYRQSPAGPNQESRFSQAMEHASHPDSWKAIAGFGPRALEEGVDYAGGSAPSALPAAMAPAALSKAAGAIKNAQGSFVGRRAVDAAQGYATGAASGPLDKSLADRHSSGQTGAAISTGMGMGVSALAKPLSYGDKLFKFFGKKLAGVSDDIANSYANNAGVADDMAARMKSDPESINKEMQQKILSARGKLKEVTAPERQRLGEKFTGKSVEVAPEQFKGSSVEKELRRSHNMTNPPREVQHTPVRPHEVKASPVEEFVEYGKPTEQVIPHGPEFGYSTPKVQVSEVKRGFRKAGEPETLETLFLKDGPVQSTHVEAPMPDRMQIPAAQGQRLKRGAQEAADHNFSLNPQGYSAANDIEAQAGRKLRAALDGSSPGTVPLNDSLEEAARMGQYAGEVSKNNPARMLNPSESIGNTQMRQVQQYFDKRTGSDFQSLSKALEAGTEMNKPGEGIIENLITKPSARALLRNSKRLKGASESLYESNPALIDAILRNRSDKE